MLNGLLDNFALPEGAADAIKRSGSFKDIDDGVGVFMAHDKGISYRFFYHADYLSEQSKALSYEKYANILMIEWFVDKKHRPTERVRFLPSELLSFDKEGNCIGGLYFQSYKAFIEGQNTPGLPLSKWGILDDASVATLSADHIFSVEQFAALPRSRVQGRYPPEIMEAFERSIQYVNGKNIRELDSKHGDEILRLKQEAARKDNAIRELQEQMAQLTQSVQERRGRPRKNNDNTGDE